MVANPERETKKPSIPDGVQERQEEFVVPERIQDVAQTQPSQVTAQVTDDQGQPLIQTPSTKQTTIQVPDTQESLIEKAKAPAVEAAKWAATYWLRVIKKAAVLGQKIILGKKE